MHILLRRQRVQELHGLLTDAVLGKVKEQVFKIKMKFVEALRIAGKHVLHLDVLDGGKVGLQGLPGGGCIESGSHCSWL